MEKATETNRDIVLWALRYGAAIMGMIAAGKLAQVLLLVVGLI